MKKQPQDAPIRKSYRRQLRQASTKPEQLIWAVVRNRKLQGVKFRRQQSIGPFIVDFVCQERHLIIELDGGYHDDVFDADQSRQQFLELEGYRVIRFSNEDVLVDVEAVAIAIKRALDERKDEGGLNRSSPSP